MPASESPWAAQLVQLSATLASADAYSASLATGEVRPRYVLHFKCPDMCQHARVSRCERLRKELWAFCANVVASGVVQTD